MYISDTAITKPVLTVVAMLMLVVFGIVALTQLDTDEYPEIDAPVVVVAMPYPGASPDIVEREVVDPIEEAISGISGIDRMRSSSLDSFANIVVEFDFSKDPKVATQEIRDKISAIRNDLPPEMEEPILTQFDPADRPIVSLTLSSPGLTGAELTRMADPDITRRLRGISGVATGQPGRRHRARAGGGNPPARSGSHRRQRRAAGAGAAVAEPGRRRWAASRARSTSGRSG